MIHEASDTAKRLVDDLTQKYLLELKSMKSNCAEQAEVVFHCSYTSVYRFLIILLRILTLLLIKRIKPNTLYRVHKN